MIHKAINIIRRSSRSDDGSIMLLGLAVLGFLIVPLTAILYFASLTSSATITARGTAFSAAYAGLSRSIDQNATLNAGQPQLYAVGSNELNTASEETGVAVSNSWVYSGIGRQLPGSSLVLQDLPAWSGYTTSGGTNPLRGIGVVNIAEAPQAAYVKAQQNGSSADCRVSSGFKKDGGNTLCWVDHRSKELYQSRNVPTGSFDSDTWDHYSSGVETQIKLNMPLFVSGLQAKKPRFRASASFAQPCLGNDCAQ